MTYKIVVEPEALNDLMAIYKYISEQDSRNKAAKFRVQIKICTKADTDPLITQLSQLILGHMT